jgi:heat shock protein HslJ
MLRDLRMIGPAGFVIAGRHLMRWDLSLCISLTIIAVGANFGCKSDDKPSAPPPGSTASPAKLEGTYWKLVELGGATVVAPDSSGGGEPHLMLDPNNKRAVGSGGVNRFSGSYEVAGNGSLRFSPLAVTRMAGPEPMMQQEERFFAAFNATTGYVLSGETLELKGDGRTLAKFSATDKR